MMDILNINLNLLKSFWAVYKTGGIIKAAKILDVAPPAVSYNIKQLESQLGVKLFNTHKRGTDPTADAKTLFPLVENAFESLLKVNDQLCPSDSGTIRVGVSAMIMTVILSKFFSVFKTKYPNIKFELHHHPKNDYLTMLENGEIDVAVMQISRKPAAGYIITKITTLDTTFYTSKKFAAANKIGNEITMEQFKKLPFVMFSKSRTMYNKLEETFGGKITAIEVPSSFAAFYMVMDGQGVGYLHEQSLDVQGNDQIVKFKIAGLPPLPNAVIDCISDKKSAKIVALFIRELKEYHAKK